MQQSEYVWMITEWMQNIFVFWDFFRKEQNIQKENGKFQIMKTK